MKWVENKKSRTAIACVSCQKSKKKCKGGKVNEIRCTECEKKKKFLPVQNVEKKDKVSQGSGLLYDQMRDTVIEGEQYLTYDENNFLIEFSYIFE
ncbi:19491_t:CDS:2, partial [Racocetra persica]